MRTRRVTRNHMGSPAQVRVLLVSIFFFLGFLIFVGGFLENLWGFVKLEAENIFAEEGSGKR
jgi:hypothetical protein